MNVKAHIVNSSQNRQSKQFLLIDKEDLSQDSMSKRVKMVHNRVLYKKQSCISNLNPLQNKRQIGKCY